MKKILAALLLTTAAASTNLLTTPASAAACAARAPVATVKMLRDSDGKQFFVPVSINGSNKLMMLSTSMGTSTFLTEAVDAMNLPVTNLRAATMAVSNGSRGYDVAAAKIGIGNTKPITEYYLLFPPQADGATLFKANIVGWLGLDVLTQYDFDLNFQTNTLTLYDFNDCSGAPRAGAQAVAYDVDSKGRIIVPVTLDGTPLRASLDTSWDSDALNLNIAEDMMGYDPAKHAGEKVAGVEVETYRSRFSNFSLGGISISNPTVLVIQDKLRNQATEAPVTGTNIRKTEDNRMPDFLIGNTLLAQYHVYVAAKEHKLYITPVAR